MSLPRPALVGILGLTLILAALLATRGLTGGTSVLTTGLPEATTEKPRANERQRMRGAAPAPVTVGLPKAVARALAERDLVVLLFAQQGAAEDVATRAAVRAVDRDPRVRAFTDRVENLVRYRSIVADLPISQAPAIVIVSPDGKARVLEGFVDAGSLRQHVADARR